MYCPKCGKENPDDAQVCSSCSSALPKAPVTAEYPTPRISGLAIAAFVLGILSLFSLGLTIIPAIVLGIVAIVIIEKSGGRLTGTVFAVLGIVVPVLAFFGMSMLALPALSRNRQIAFRMACGKNLSGIGKAMIIYSNDYDGELPRSGGRNSVWASVIPNWRATSRFSAYGLSADGSGGAGSISSCFYLLVRYAEVTPKSFVCKGDEGTTEFDRAEHNAGDGDLVDLWDFGTDSSWGGGHHCSYSYHMPFGLYALTTSNEPAMAVAADRNPWMDSPAAMAKYMPGWPPFHPSGGREAVKAGNAIAHQEDGQNVLFLDSHVGFEDRSFCGMNDDNIYTYWDGGDIRIGGTPRLGSEPSDRLDSLLVHDDGGMGGYVPPPKGRTCFTAETRVWVDGALVQISEVAAGHTVGKFLCTMPTVCLEQVEQVQEHEGTFECREVVLESGNRIGVVGAHCFLLDFGQWIAAQNLRSGLRLKTLTGTVGIKSVTKRAVPYTGKVYNLKVNSSDQYMVGKDAVIVRDY
ncbi:MAG: zinc-ribbon domain-containing protein [Planctomycetota bacterium]|jgi:hypothetical protein